jgi:predicted nucleotidyltransferase
MLENDALQVVQGPYRSLILFGSHARGDARPDSDVDIVQVSSMPAVSYNVGVWSISVYTEGLLRALASSGNLFALHLIREARVIAGDPDILWRLSNRFVPRPPNEIVQDVRQALPLLDPTMPDTERLGSRLLALARYLLRTFIYARSQDGPNPSYNLESAAQSIGLSESVGLLRGRDVAHDKLVALRRVLETVLEARAVNRFGSIEAFIVNVEETSRFAAELGIRMLTDDDVPYESVSRLVGVFLEDLE